MSVSRALPRRIDMHYLAKVLVQLGASDLHVKPSRPPLFRMNGQLIPAKMDVLSEEVIRSMILEVLNPTQKQDLEVKKSIDFSFLVQGVGRFRCNAYHQRGSLSAAVRLIPLNVPKLETLGLPPILQGLCQKERGLILLTGSTGSGKSTTLAAMVQWMNENRHLHILTVEDPIEFIYQDLKSSISQREVGMDTLSARDALISGLRQDPDVIVIGEARDAETIRVALTAAETGHLVITTLHTNDARSTLDRILDIFQGADQNQVRVQLASCLVGVVSQQLVLKATGDGRLPACEVMIKSPAIEGYILKNELSKISEAIESSNTYYQMQSMNLALEKMVQAKEITLEEAIKSSLSPEDLKLRLSGLDRQNGYNSGS